MKYFNAETEWRPEPSFHHGRSVEVARLLASDDWSIATVAEEWIDRGNPAE